MEARSHALPCKTRRFNFILMLFKVLAEGATALSVTLSGGEMRCLLAENYSNSRAVQRYPSLSHPVFRSRPSYFGDRW